MLKDNHIAMVVKVPHGLDRPMDDVSQSDALQARVVPILDSLHVYGIGTRTQKLIYDHIISYLC